MKICVVQIRSAKGDVQKNMERHKRLIELAATYGAEVVVFPELSLTGYEPGLAEDLAVNSEDRRFDEFQEISDARQITIGLGMPTRTEAGICISMLLFQPRLARQTYSKKYLHPDEEEFFVPGQNSVDLVRAKNKVALAICYELSVPEHSEHAFKRGAEVYVASVAKSKEGVDRAIETLSEIANKYSMTVVMSNCLGFCDNFESAGKTSIWNNKGQLRAQLDDTHEGILVFDTATQELIEKSI